MVVGGDEFVDEIKSCFQRVGDKGERWVTGFNRKEFVF